MRRTFTLLLMLCSLPLASLLAQDPIRERQVPPEVREDFGYRFHDAEKVHWYRQGRELYAARFLVKESEHEVVYQDDGMWQQTKAQESYADAPDSLKSWCALHYDGYRVDDFHRVSTRSYGILYDVLLAQGNERQLLTFDQHGRVLDKQAWEVTEVVADREADAAEEDAEVSEEERAQDDWKAFFRRKQDGPEGDSQQ